MILQPVPRSCKGSGGEPRAGSSPLGACPAHVSLPCLPVLPSLLGEGEVHAFHRLMRGFGRLFESCAHRTSAQQKACKQKLAAAGLGQTSAAGRSSPVHTSTMDSARLLDRWFGGWLSGKVVIQWNPGLGSKVEHNSL